MIYELYFNNVSIIINIYYNYVYINEVQRFIVIFYLINRIIFNTMHIYLMIYFCGPHTAWFNIF